MIDKKEYFELERRSWLFLTDFTHWVAEKDIQEAINSLETMKKTMLDYLVHGKP